MKGEENYSVSVVNDDKNNLISKSPNFNNTPRNRNIIVPPPPGNDNIDNPPLQISNEPDSQNENIDKEINTNYMTARFILIFIALSGVVLNTVYGFALPNGDIKCLLDQSFIITQPINEYLKEHVNKRHIIIAFSSFFVDSIVLFMAIHWSLYGKSWRLFISMISFYACRGFIQVSF